MATHTESCGETLHRLIKEAATVARLNELEERTTIHYHHGRINEVELYHLDGFIAERIAEIETS